MSLPRSQVAADRRGTRLPVVAVMGRPNVGKSSLVNRIVGRRVAIVEQTPGVTRDRNELEASWCGTDMRVIDTGGWLPGGGTLERQVSAQSEKVLPQADLILLVVDVTVGITTEDEAVAGLLRRSGTDVMVVVNKVDSAGRESDAWEFASLGLGDPHMVSALHGRGSGDLLDEVVRRLPHPEQEIEPEVARPGAEGGAGSQTRIGTDGLLGGSIRTEDGSSVSVAGRVDSESADDRVGPEGAEGPEGPERVDDREGPESTGRTEDVGIEHPGVDGDLGEEGGQRKIPAVALVGRPNVGKSTLLNRLAGEERSVTHDMPGTTTDSIDTVVMLPDGPIRFVDTAGMRRRARTAGPGEYYSLVRALQAIDRSDVALLVIDAVEGVTHQDQRLAERIDAGGSPVVIVLNKWDLVDTEGRARVREQVSDRLGFLSYASTVALSALSGRNVAKLLPAIRNSISAYGRRIPTGELNTVVQAAQRAHPAPGSKVLYATQGAIEPPTITLFATRELSAPWLRYLERSIREHFALGPTPLELRVRRRDGEPGRPPPVGRSRRPRRKAS
ncbi:MAG: ribosome biogenesis GTPase Der [Actinomycetota bacterium]|nr:ribosome biogenesis GTPase Der [Actinomycetota bacterium]